MFILFFIISIICASILSYLKVNLILILLITIIVLFSFEITFLVIRNNKIRNVLDLDCDPERYLELMDKQERRYKKNERGLTYLDINRSAAYLSLGDVRKAKEYLDGVNTSLLSEKNGSYYVYTINRILCLYELEQTEEAEKLYSTELVRLSPLDKRLKKSAEILIGERYYYLNRYQESHEYLKKLLNIDLEKRKYLGVLFRLAQMDIMKGEREAAAVKYKKIAKYGNKLWIAKAAGEALKEITTDSSEGSKAKLD